MRLHVCSAVNFLIKNTMFVFNRKSCVRICFVSRYKKKDSQLSLSARRIPCLRSTKAFSGHEKQPKKMIN